MSEDAEKPLKGIIKFQSIVNIWSLVFTTMQLSGNKSKIQEVRVGLYVDATLSVFFELRNALTNYS